VTGVQTCALPICLNDDASAALSRLYIKARTEHRAEQDALTGRLRDALRNRDREALGSMRGELERINETAKAELRSEAAIFLNGPSAERATDLLTVFSPFWDRMVANAREIGLGEDRMRAVLEAGGAYALDMAAAIGPGADRQRRAEIVRAARERLETTLSESLDQDQIGKVMGGTSPPRRGAGGGGGFRGRPPLD